MKQVFVPAPITLLDPYSGDPVLDLGCPIVRTFARYAIDFWLCDERLAVPIGTESQLDAHDRLVNVLLPLFRAAKEGPLNLEDADHARLLPIVRDTKLGFKNPLHAGQFAAFHRAVENAQPCPP